MGDLDALARTREAWHAIAEHVLAAARYRAEARIGLRATPGGFGTPTFGSDERVRVEITDLVVTHGDLERRARLSTLRDAAELVGITPGAPVEVYRPVTPLDLDAPLSVDIAAATTLAAWFAFGTEALEGLRAAAPPDDAPSLVQLWPEHFDLGLELGDEARSGRATFGGSPGDDEHAEPYLYVTPWAELAPSPYWNDTAFRGASVSYTDLDSAADPAATARAFFERGRELLASGR